MPGRSQEGELVSVFPPAAGLESPAAGLRVLLTLSRPVVGWTPEAAALPDADAPGWAAACEASSCPGDGRVLVTEVGGAERVLFDALFKTEGAMDEWEGDGEDEEPTGSVVLRLSPGSGMVAVRFVNDAKTTALKDFMRIGRPFADGWADGVEDEED